MTERKQVSIDGLVRHLDSGIRPIDKKLARLTRELYFSSLYRATVIRGANSTDEVMTLDALRLIPIEGSRLESISLNVKNDREEAERLRGLLVQETGGLPVVADDFRVLQSLSLSLLRRNGLSIAAGMQIGHSVSTGNEVVQVLYPRAYRNVIPMPELYRDDLGFGIAISFLKSVRFGNSALHIPLASE